jgi:hypothetical protein
MTVEEIMREKRWEEAKELIQRLPKEVIERSVKMPSLNAFEKGSIARNSKNCSARKPSI